MTDDPRALLDWKLISKETPLDLTIIGVKILIWSHWLMLFGEDWFNTSFVDRMAAVART